MNRTVNITIGTDETMVAQYWTYTSGSTVTFGSGNQVPGHRVTGTPEIGQSLSYEIRHLPSANLLGLLHIGLRALVPISLAGLGMGTCTLNVFPLALNLGVALDATGGIALPSNVPNEIGLIGSALASQAAVFDPGTSTPFKWVESPGSRSRWADSGTRPRVSVPRCNGTSRVCLRVSAPSIGPLRGNPSCVGPRCRSAPASLTLTTTPNQAMKQHSRILISATLATAAAAQGPSLSTQTTVGVFARSGARVQVDAIAPNTPIIAARRIEATIDVAAASLGAGPGPTPDSFALGMQGHASAVAAVRVEAGTTTTPLNTPPAPGPVAFLLAWRGAARRFHLNMDGDASGGGAASVAVDVGDNGSVEFRQAVDGSAHTFAFDLGGLGGATTARVVLNGHAQPAAMSLRGVYQLGVALNADALAEQPCQFTNYGAGCDGLGLGGVDRIVGMTHNIELNVRGGFPNLPVVLMFGERPLDLPIPGFPCRLLVNPLVTVAIQADQNGNLDNTFFVGPGLQGFVFFQAVVLRRTTSNTLELKTSNGARMECGR